MNLQCGVWAIRFGGYWFVMFHPWRLCWFFSTPSGLFRCRSWVKARLSTTRQQRCINWSVILQNIEITQNGWDLCLLYQCQCWARNDQYLCRVKKKAKNKLNTAWNTFKLIDKLIDCCQTVHYILVSLIWKSLLELTLASVVSLCSRRLCKRIRKKYSTYTVVQNLYYRSYSV